MGPSSRSPTRAPEGFEGAIAGLGLADVIQLNGLNRFSGCITVQYEDSVGLLFFRDGEIIHAEHAGKAGEEAFFDIMQWPGGRFTLQPNVTSASRSLNRSWKYLLMEAHRLLDEKRRTGALPPPLPKEGPPKRASASAVIERIRQIPGVAYAVLLTKDGSRVGDDSYEAESLEGQTAYLALVGTRLGQIFGAGDVVAAVTQGPERNLLVLATKSHYLGVLVRGDAQPGAVEAEVRKVVASGR